MGISILGLTRRKVLGVFIGVVFAAGAATLLLTNAPPLTNCRFETSADLKEYRVPALKTVAQPWKGRHHVYSVFMIPEQYKYDHLYSAKLIIQGFETEFRAGSAEDEDPYTEVAKPGYYVKRVHVSTRTALWFLLTGRFGDLRTSCHWWLILRDRGWTPTISRQ